MRHNGIFQLSFSLILVLFIPLSVQAAQMPINAALSHDKVKVGHTLTVTSNTEDISYESSDTHIAYINQNGYITGKNPGTTTISVSKSGYDTKQFKITVLANEKLPILPICFDEIKLRNLSIVPGDTDKKIRLSATIKNSSPSETLEKITYTFEVKAANNPLLINYVTMQAEKLAPRQTSQVITSEGPSSGRLEDVKLISVQLYSGDMLLTYIPDKSTFNYTQRLTMNPSSNSSNSLHINTSNYTGDRLIKTLSAADSEASPENPSNPDAPLDTSTASPSVPADTNIPEVSVIPPPVIYGLTSENSASNTELALTIYPDKKYLLTKYIKAKDSKGNPLQVTVDTSEIDWTKKGAYPVTYSATDPAGNTTSLHMTVQLRLVETADQYADTILKKITNSSWSDTQNANAIYQYVRKNLSYVDSNDQESWEKSGIYGLKYKNGNCFVFYSLSKLLLTRYGIPNLTVRRSPGHNSNHWWNLVYVQDGWYHLDTTPMRKIAITCLITNEQLIDYSNKAGSEHVWDTTAYPDCATKKISTVVMGKRY